MNKDVEQAQASNPSQEGVKGFSKLSKLDKINYVTSHYFEKSHEVKEFIQSFWYQNQEGQKVFDEFSENTISNFYLPYGVVPNFKINQKLYCVPMAIEESSVVAACGKSANFWLTRGGFQTEVLSTLKVGQVHFYCPVKPLKLKKFFEGIRPDLLAQLSALTSKMRERGGGLVEMELRDCNQQSENYFQIYLTFETCDAMGANFINSVLESLARAFKESFFNSDLFSEKEKNLQVIMAILSNYTPECLVKAQISCPVADLTWPSMEIPPELFAWRMQKAVEIARVDVSRATTHNKGIMNGVDAVILATGNDFRAIESCVHAYAARDGSYRGLTECQVQDGQFTFSLTLPLALGTVGGLTSLHPLARLSLDMLDRPNARELMGIVAAVGLAQNFAALRSLTTSGIQKGHMKMHLLNILNSLAASEKEKSVAVDYFKNKTVSYSAVRELLSALRNYQ